jgi:nucleoid-associated protein YgaU
MFGRVLFVAVLAVLIWAIVARSSSGSGNPRHYVVKPRDTLWTIAVRTYGGDPREGVWKIHEANHLGGTLLRPGERLTLPP